MKHQLRNTHYAIILLFSLFLSFLPYSPTRADTIPAYSWPEEWQADSSFFNVWSRPDAPVAMQAASRSWLWGPVPFAVANEPYAESPTGLRLVEYLDKGRMEINDPSADCSSPWFVTSGLLVQEMVTGQYQTGNNTFQTRPPADIPVAGDDYSPEAPTYASFANLTRRAITDIKPCCPNIGYVFPRKIARDGSLQLVDSHALGQSIYVSLTPTSYDAVTGHNIPRVFADWMAQSGPVLENGHLTTSNLIDPLYLLGHPITEPYWADIRIDGKPATVLIQLYERRALTYNPANPPEWQVEMANVGRAYYNWLYRETLPAPAIATNLSTQGAANSILFHGYNWPPNALVHLRIALNNTSDSLIGPLDITTNSQGRFASDLLYTPQLEAAQKAKTDIRAYAESNGTSISLPFATPSSSAPIPISGYIVGIENAAAQNTYTLTLSSSEGTPTRVTINPSTSITFAEGTPAHPTDLDTNAYISLQAIQSGGTLTATSLQLLSTSSSHAWVGYTYTPDKKHLTVTGASWPSSSNVSFTLLASPSTSTTPVGAPPAPFATLKTDSRGNLTGTITPTNFEGQRLLEAQSASKTTVSHLIYPQSDAKGPDVPEITLVSQNGMQQANFGDLCCAGSDYLPPYASLPAFALPTAHGEILTLRSQYGPNPNTGVSPYSFSATYYPLPANIELPDLAANYSQNESHVVYTTTNTSGTPFTLPIPQTLPAGLYGIYLGVKWSVPAPANSPDLTTPYLMVINVK